MVYKRKIYSELLSHAQSPLVTVLTGMRRTGKTTLVKQLLSDIPNKNSLYLDLQSLDNRQIFSIKNYDAIRQAFISRGLLPTKPMVVAIDEIQLAPDCPGVIKYLFDTYQIKFIVTGSSSYYLKNLFSESLSGRKKIFELYPLDFGEFLEFKEIKHVSDSWQEKSFDLLEYQRLLPYYEEYAHFGGFPQVVLAPTPSDKQDILSDIMSSYINIDARSLADFSDSRNLFSLAKLLSGRVGSRIEYTTLSRLTGISRPTIVNYLEFLEKTYLIATIPVFTKNTGREIVKSKKLYFCDTGLANSLGQISSGAQFENTVFNQLSRLGKMQYYALKTGQEIDFVLNSELALETKETPIESDFRTLSNLSATAGIKNSRLIGRYQSPRFTDYVWGGSIL